MAGLGFLILVALYFLPTIVAASRHKQNTLAIGALNLFLGWSFIGWIVAFIWALSADPQIHQHVVNVSQNVGIPYYPQQGMPYQPQQGMPYQPQQGVPQQPYPVQGMPANPAAAPQSYLAQQQYEPPAT